MMVNPDKFKTTALDRSKSTNSEVKFIVGSKQIHELLSVDILGITTDDKLNFNLHIDEICLKSANHLNPLVILKCFSGNKQRKILIVLFFQI